MIFEILTIPDDEHFDMNPDSFLILDSFGATIKTCPYNRIMLENGVYLIARETQNGNAEIKVLNNRCGDLMVGRTPTKTQKEKWKNIKGIFLNNGELYEGEDYQDILTNAKKINE